MVDVTELKRWSKRYPEFGTAPLPIEPCISQDYFEREREYVFLKCWLEVCREEEIPNPGDFFNRHIQICNTHVLLMRGDDGRIRAFHNMCSHRGNKLVWDESGCERSHACKFHGWVYDNQGRLVDVPDEANFFDLDKEKNGLTPIACDVWEGFVFVNLDPSPAQSLHDYLGGVVDMLAGFPFKKLKLGYAYKGNLACNWKIAVDSQQEAYHAVHLHRRTVGNAFISKENPFMHALDIQFFGPHRMISLAGYDHPLSPVEALAHKLGWTIKKKDHGFLDPDNMPKGVNPTRSKNWAFEIYLIFPNFWIATLDGAYQTHNFWPVAVDKMYQEIRMFINLPTNAGEVFATEYAKCINRDTWLEDFSTLETSQTVLGSGGKTHFILQDEEILLRHFYKVLNAYTHPQRQAAE